MSRKDLNDDVNFEATTDLVECKPYYPVKSENNELTAEDKETINHIAELLIIEKLPLTKILSIHDELPSPSDWRLLLAEKNNKKFNDIIDKLEDEIIFSENYSTVKEGVDENDVIKVRGGQTLQNMMNARVKRKNSDEKVEVQNNTQNNFYGMPLEKLQWLKEAMNE